MRWCSSASLWMCVRCALLAAQPVIMNLNTHHNGLLCSHRWWLQRTLSNASWFWKWPSCMLPWDLPRPSSAPRPSSCWQDYMRYTWGELTSVVRATSDDDDGGMCLRLWCALFNANKSQCQEMFSHFILKKIPFTPTLAPWYVRRVSALRDSLSLQCKRSIETTYVKINISPTGLIKFCSWIQLLESWANNKRL